MKFVTLLFTVTALLFADKDSWNLKFVSEKASLLVSENDNPKIAHKVVSGTAGISIVIATDFSRHYKLASLEGNNNYKVGGFAFHLEEGKATISHITNCNISISVDSIAQTITAKITPVKNKVQFSLTTGVTDYKLSNGNTFTTHTLRASPSDMSFTVRSGTRLSLKLEKPGFKDMVKNINIGSSDTILYIKDFEPKSKLKMAAFSTLFPGSGQRYGDRYTAAGWYTTLSIISGVFSGFELFMVNEAKRDYEDMQEAYQNSLNPTVRTSLKESRDKALETWKYHNNLLWAGLGTLGVTWTWNIVDPFIFSHSKKSRVKEPKKFYADKEYKIAKKQGSSNNNVKKKLSTDKKGN